MLVDKMLLTPLVEISHVSLESNALLFHAWLLGKLRLKETISNDAGPVCMHPIRVGDG